MKILVAGAGGYLGSHLIQVLHKQGHEVVGLDRKPAGMEPHKEHLSEIITADVTNPEQLSGKLNGIETVISTIGLEFPQKDISYWDIDYQGNLNLLNEAQNAGVKKFLYVSVFQPTGKVAATCPPLVESKMAFEKELMNSGLSWVIFRPVGYFKDIINIFLKSARQGTVRLVGDGNTRTNPLHPMDFSEFIAANLSRDGEVLPVGGPEEYSYNELSEIAFEAVGNPPKFKRLSVGSFKVFMHVLRLFKPLTYPLLQFTLWCMTIDMIAPPTGSVSIRKTIKERA